MIAINVDDEIAMLDELNQAVEASPDIAEIHSFLTITETLEWMENNRADLAFLDINMRGMGGIGMAKRIQEMQPECKIIFCTGYREYAADAFEIHASGFLVKPIRAEAVQKEIDHIKRKESKQNLLQVQCFGNFEVYYQGTPLHFQRRKTKELLACLIAKRGSSMTSREICVRLWEEDINLDKNLAYLYQLFGDLNKRLEEIGLTNVIVKAGYSYAVNTEKVSCDYFDYLKDKHKERFRGAFMLQYSWAEEIGAALVEK